jgi:hypothetical protein
VSNFAVFKAAVAKQFAMMQEHGLFRTAVDKDELWAIYLASFPAGTNQMFRQRTEYDCSCCRQFVRNIGDVVSIIGGKLVSIWDIDLSDTTFSPVATALSALARAHPIEDIFLHYERSIGTDRSFEDRMGKAFQWNHFFVNLPASAVKRKAEIGTILGERRSTVEVMLRGLRELQMSAVDTVLELIGQNSLYRGEEHRAAVVKFRALKVRFDREEGEQAQSLFAWSVLGEPDAQGVARMRNTAIGTLLVDLSEGMDLEVAVRSFEQKVAPANYKRPSALITQKMIDSAKETIEKLGLTSALDRRYAQIEDISVNDLLFADRSIRKAVDGNVFDQLSATASAKPKNLDRVEEISIDKFVSDVLPNAQTVEVLFEGKHQGNLVSLIAPSDPTAGRLFKWDNGFSWSYNGDMADSIKERVKQAGGNVTGDLCCRLAWYNHDDLDFHIVDPQGREVYYAAKQNLATGCQLDVDMNAGTGTTREPVENIFFPDRRRIPAGNYRLFVQQFRQRETENVGFDVELDYLGEVTSFSYGKAVRQDEKITVAEFTYSAADGIRINSGLPSSAGRCKTVWGVDTNTFHRVRAIMLSPNYWSGREVGNKHFFFVLEGCRNDGDARGFFNEFLDNSLDRHRKVFEVVGSKMKATDGADGQLSGLGFSSTQKNVVVVKVTGAFTRMLKIVF